jgi:hypothetical protein
LTFRSAATRREEKKAPIPYTAVAKSAVSFMSEETV